MTGWTMETPEIDANIFIGWANDRSRKVADALHGWLRSAVQRAKPWKAPNDIDSGKQWRNLITDALKAVRVGIVCITPESLENRWLNFEAGSLAIKMVDGQPLRVIPYCFGVKPRDIGEPLSSFQGEEADEEGTLRLVTSINHALPDPVPDDIISDSFAEKWKKLDAKLREIPGAAEPPKKRQADDVLGELLERVQAIQRHLIPSEGFRNFYGDLYGGVKPGSPQYDELVRLFVAQVMGTDEIVAPSEAKVAGIRRSLADHIKDKPQS